MIENRPVIANQLQASLENLGYQVSGILNTIDGAIAFIESDKPDLVLIETKLFENGLDITAIEQIKANCQVPIVYLETNETPSQLQSHPVKHPYPYGYIFRPFEPHYLAATIETALFYHRNEMEQNRELQQLRSQLQAKSQQIAMLAHEFGNPLAFMQTSLDLLQAKKDELPQQKKQKHLNYIQLGIQKLKKLMEDMFLLESIQSSQVEDNKQRLDIVELCQELVEVWQLNSTENCQVKIVWETENRVLLADRRMLWHGLSNLLANAIKYSPEKGQVILRIFGDNTHMYFQIEDNGIGIPAEAFANLFQPFCRATNVGKIPGKGLGLAIVKKCVDKLGGKIDVFSQVGKGTTFKVAIPR